MADRKTIGAGWKKVTDKGTYIALSFKAEELSGINLANCWVSLVKNDRKQKQNHPDYNITASPKAQVAQTQSQPQADDFGF